MDKSKKVKTMEIFDFGDESPNNLGTSQNTAKKNTPSDSKPQRIYDREQIARKMGKLLKMYRVQADLSQTEIAKTLGMTNSQISYYEKGKTIPPLDILFELCYILKVSPQVIIELTLSSKEIKFSPIFIEPALVTTTINGS